MKNLMYVILFASIIAAGVWVTVQRQRDAFKTDHSKIPDSVWKDTFNNPMTTVGDVITREPNLKDLLHDKKIKYIGISGSPDSAIYVVEITDSCYHVDRYGVKASRYMSTDEKYDSSMKMLNNIDSMVTLGGNVGITTVGTLPVAFGKKKPKKSKIHWNNVWDEPIVYHLNPHLAMDSNIQIIKINSEDSIWKEWPPHDTVTIHTSGNFLFEGPKDPTYKNLILRVIIQRMNDASVFDTIYFNPYEQKKAWDQVIQK